jgi:hypothetical protein
VKPHDYRDLIAAYLDATFAAHGVVVYTEVSLGKTIIGKNRKLDVLALRKADQRALAIEGWSEGVLHTLQGSRRAVHCLPERSELARTTATRELDHVVAAVFGFWDHVIPEDRLFSKSPQLSLALKGPRKAEARPAPESKKVADDEG